MPKRAFSLLDKKTGVIKGLETPFEYLAGSAMPQFAQYATLAVKAFLIAPVLAPLAIVGSFAAGRFFRRQTDKAALQAEQGDNFYRLDQQKDRTRFVQRYGQVGETFAGRFIRMSGDLGFNNVPRIKIDTKGDDAFSISAWGLASDGSAPVICIGEELMESLTSRELSLAAGHELVHARQNNFAGLLDRQAHKYLSHAVSGALLMAATFGALPLLPVLGLVAICGVADHAMNSARERHWEKIADRGAAILTGDGGLFGSLMDNMYSLQLKKDGLKQRNGDDKPKTLVGKIREAASYATPSGITRLGNKILFRLAPEKMLHFIFDRHPEIDTRKEMISDFEAKNWDWAEARRAKLSASFNDASPWRKNTPKAINTPKNGNNITY